MATLAGIEARLSPLGHCRMGSIWVKLWKRTEVVCKAAKFTAAWRAGCNFATAQWAGLLSWCSIMGRSLGGQTKPPTPCCISSWMILDKFGGHRYAKECRKEVYSILDEEWLSGTKSRRSWSAWMRLVWATGGNHG